MFILKHAGRENKPYLMSATISLTGLEVSFSDEAKAKRFVSRGAAVQVLHALYKSYGQFYPVEVDC
ncbi:hypothetical protein [Streptococcus porci]|uniref:hypothetical protein n=1 Tax=Streptococcus porci TaxID=502567 RepID=UPI00040B6C5C|nr:hypothetical protein [Streptococcus porci]